MRFPPRDIFRKWGKSTQIAFHPNTPLFKSDQNGGLHTLRLWGISQLLSVGKWRFFWKLPERVFPMIPKQRNFRRFRIAHPPASDSAGGRNVEHFDGRHGSPSIHFFIEGGASHLSPLLLLRKSPAHFLNDHWCAPARILFESRPYAFSLKVLLMRGSAHFH